MEWETEHIQSSCNTTEYLNKREIQELYKFVHDMERKYDKLTECVGIRFEHAGMGTGVVLIYKDEERDITNMDDW